MADEAQEQASLRERMVSGLAQTRFKPDGPSLLTDAQPEPPTIESILDLLEKNLTTAEVEIRQATDRLHHLREILKTMKRIFGGQ